MVKVQLFELWHKLLALAAKIKKVGEKAKDAVDNDHDEKH
jgi:hypothetical protein